MRNTFTTRALSLTFIFAFALTLLLTTTARAQTGMTPTDFDALSKITTWKPEPTSYAENFSVDLRERLPPVGNQSMGDCAAWAFGYAGKSFLEANDQAWRPDRPARIFSPSFIYNSLATGEQSGLTPLQVLDFLRDKGCATLATTPYRVRDYSTKPTPRAKEEAELFKISSYAILDSGTEIRSALQQGNIVQIGVRTNPIFNGGTYELYTSELHARGCADRKPGQLHGYHALTVVGFDDTKHAFLIMNSWGTRWGQSGYCWVSYDVANIFNSKTSNIETNLIDWAVVMYDVKEKVDIGPDGIAINAPLDKNTVAAAGRAEYRGFDAKLKKHVFFFNASLTGQKKALDLVTSVEWTFPRIAGGEGTLKATSRPTGFGITGASVMSEFTVTGKVAFSDGTSKDIQFKYAAQAPQADNRNLKFKVTSRYYGKNNADKPLWQYEIKPDFYLQDRDDIVKTTWDLSSIPNAVEKEWSSEEGGKFTSPRYNGPTGLIFAPAKIKARYFFNDGSVKDLTLDIPTDDPIDESYRLESEFREDGVGADGRMVYSYQVRLRLPMKDWYQIDKVNWDLGPGVSNRNPHSHSYNQYTAAGTSTRDFRARLSITRHNGGPLEFDKWIELGPTARFANAQRLDLDQSETYLGRANGTPTWEMKVFPVGDTASFEKIDRVEYTLPENYNPRTYTVNAAQTPTLHMAIDVTKPLNIPAKIFFKDGSTLSLATSLAPHYSSYDGLNLQVRYSDEPSKKWDGVSLKIAGNRWDLDRLRSADYRFERTGFWDRKVETPGILLWPEKFWSSAQVSSATTLFSVVTFADGSQEWLQSKFNGEMFPTAPSDLRIQLRERFAGFSPAPNSSAQYALAATLAGEVTLIDKIASIEYSLTVDENPPIKIKSDAGWKPTEFTINARATLTAEVKFKPEANLPDRTLPVVLAHATAPRTEPKLLLRELKQPWNSDTKRFWVLFLDGWESQLKNVASVTYTFPKDVADSPVTITNRNADPLAPFAYRGTSKAPATVEALITMTDKSTQKLSLDVGTPVPPKPETPALPLPEKLTLTITELPVPGDPETKEWQISINGPWNAFTNLTHINYCDEAVTGIPKILATLTPAEKWTDSPNPYTFRLYRKQKPSIQAELKYTPDKPSVTIK